MMMTLHGESCISGIPLVLAGLVWFGGANEHSHVVGTRGLLDSISFCKSSDVIPLQWLFCVPQL